MDAYDEFELDIPAIMRVKLPEFFEKLKPAALTTENIDEIPEGAQGAYCLFFEGKLVYVGKTDAEAGFRTRLKRHSFNVQHRKGMNPTEVAFKAVRVFVFSNFDLETMLINHYTEALGERPIWNASGFGSNDPGHKREDQDPADFDVAYPVDIDIEINILTHGRHEVHAVMRALKDHLPYTFRYQTVGHWTKGHTDMRGVEVDLPPAPLTMRKVLQSCLSVLGSDWQATVMPNRIILYKETRNYTAQVEVLRA